MIRCIVTFCFALCIGNALFAQDNYKLAPRNIKTSKNSNGFYEALPPGYSTSAPPYALLIFLQGFSELGNGGTDLDRLLGNGPLFYIKANSFPTSFTVGGTTFKFVIISPQFITDTITHGQVDSIITYSLQHYNVDINRVYLTGLSKGGGVAFEYAGDSSTYAKRLAALIPFASATPPGWDTVKPRAKVIANAGLHVWAFHNLKDEVSDTITTNYVKFINQYSAPTVLATAKIYTDRDAHDSWSPAYSGSSIDGGLNIYQWMLQFQGTNIVTPLPVKFSYINAGCSEGKVVLKWKTAQENNSRNFVIERSAEGAKWSSIATVTAAGNSTLEKSYEFADLTNGADGNLYRIAENDLDGKITYSSSVKAECGLKEYFGFFPNPANNKVIFRINTSQQQKLQLRIYDSRGVLVKVYECTLPAGNAEEAIDISQLSKGVYSVEAIWGTNSRTLKLVKS